MDNRTRLLLEKTVVEIRQLRQQNAIMGARLQMFDQMMLVFNTQPAYQGQGMSPDVCYEIEKHIESEKL
jgi:hypothetical protein